jgi:glycosidase
MATSWPRRPVIYEINTWVWLKELSQQGGQNAVMLDSVPEKQWDDIASFGVDAVWLMGVWQRSPKGSDIAGKDEVMTTGFKQALPDYLPTVDNIGSAYCVYNYEVDTRLGGREGLKVAREMLRQRNMRLMLDFVPNHVAPDHPWVVEHPEYFVQGTHQDLVQAPNEFFEVGATVLAHGRDPYFAPWQDVAQLNVFNPGLRQAAIETVRSICEQCDGMRCDMAMLLLNGIFERTWGNRVGKPPLEEYWHEVISAVRLQYPNVLFLAEVYWDRERELQQLGFDYCYDKRFYDQLVHGNAESVRLHLTTSLDYQDKLVRFIENHDELRAAATWQSEQERAAAVTMMTLPGAKLLHEGQFEGRKVRTPVALARRRDEAPDLNLKDFYHKLLTKVKEAGLSTGAWQLCACRGWGDNSTYANLIAWCWSQSEEHYLVVVNLSRNQSQARVQLPWNKLAGRTWRLIDMLGDQTFEREGSEMQSSGLFVDLPMWGFHFLRF